MSSASRAVYIDMMSEDFHMPNFGSLLSIVSSFFFCFVLFSEDFQLPLLKIKIKQVAKSTWMCKKV